MSIRSVPAKVAVAGAAVLLLSGTAAAAATGSLPDAAQHAVSSALAHVSVSVPDPGDHADPHAVGSTPVGVDPTGEAKHGLCTAWAARNRGDAPRGNRADATAFRNLSGAAQDAQMSVKEFCADVLSAGHGAGSERSADPGSTGEDRGRGRNGTAHGAPAGTPPVTTPNGGGTATADGASDGADATGTGHAAPQATAGSANAGDHVTPGGHATP